MGLDNGSQRFARAVEILVDDPQPIKQRLLVAYASQLSLIDVRHDLPEELLDEFCELRNALSDAEMPYGSGQRAAEKIEAISEEEASAWARKILAMFLQLRELEVKHS